jgi:TPR repeat protein
MNNFKTTLVVLAVVTLCGCISSAIEGGHIAADTSARSGYEKDAIQGNKEAQYKLGESWCCSTDKKSGSAYDTVTAVKWLCASARQGYAPAMYKLGKIYTGDLIDGIRLLRRATTGINESMSGNTVSMPVGFAWLKLASTYGSEDAAERLASVKKDMNVTDLHKGLALADQGLSMPCEMKEVF